MKLNTFLQSDCRTFTTQIGIGELKNKRKVGEMVFVRAGGGEKGNQDEEGGEPKLKFNQIV